MFQTKEVSKLVKDCRKEYGDSYRYFLVGSIARGDKNPRDIDIIVYPIYNRLNENEWESLLKKMSIKVRGKKVDAQIIPEFHWVMNDKWQNQEFDKYVMLKGKLKYKVEEMINAKNKRRGLSYDMPYMYEEM